MSITTEMGSYMKNHESIQRKPGSRPLAGSALSLAAAITFGLYGAGAFAPVHAQATTGSIFGQAPANSGETVTVSNNAGITRQVAVDPSGRYSVGSLPLGDYTVVLQRDGQTIDSRSHVTLRVGAGTEVSLGGAANAANAQTLTAVTVQANALPTIDVTGVDSRTVITSQQLARLPLARSAEAIALLAPGVVEGSGLFMGLSTTGGSVVSFGGSSVVENAYYINGFNTTDPLSGFGGLTLPYGAIDQQEILSGGYGAAYGRSDGGVISQIGKRGTNEWHFGGQVQWTPTSLQGDPKNYYYVKADGSQGNIYRRRADNKSWTTTVDAYVGGPLIKDKLFFFAAIEAEREQGIGDSNSTTDRGIGPVTLPFETHTREDRPKWYAKLDWNINDNNVLELTGASNKDSYQGSIYNYDYDSGEQGDSNGYATSTKNGADLYTAKFTSYLTDDLTLSAQYGKMKGTYYSETPGFDPTQVFLRSPENQNPAITGGDPITNSQTVATINVPGHRSTNTNLRIDLSYKLGDHTLSAGIDNQNSSNVDGGVYFPPTGAGYAWEYNQQVDGNGNPLPNGYIVGGPGTAQPGADWQNSPWVAPTGGQNGYYVAKYELHNNASVRVSQKAQYIEDSWQINDRWLVKLGLRNDQFTNYGGDGRPYLRLTSPQWAPRVGFSWDVNGDSSFKVYGNAGRYYLALPSSVALRSAGTSLFTRTYYTYTGIDANGIPTGLTPIDTSRGAGVPLSSNGEYGQARDPRTAASNNLKSEYQDEYILGFDRKLGDSWVYGAKATYRNLRNAIDDVGDNVAIIAKMNAMGIDPNSYDATQVPASILINPGSTSSFNIPKLGGGYYTVQMDWKNDFHFNTTMKRKYYGLELYLEHPFDGMWQG
jgi:hypothetical protein